MLDLRKLWNPERVLQMHTSLLWQVFILLHNRMTLLGKLQTNVSAHWGWWTVNREGRTEARGSSALEGKSQGWAWSVGACFSLTDVRRGQWGARHLPSPSTLCLKTYKSCSRQMIILSLPSTCPRAWEQKPFRFWSFKFLDLDLRVFASA